MTKITLLLSFLLSLHQVGFSCRCSGSTKTFCDEAIAVNENQIIARIQIESRDSLGGQARILNLYKGTESKEIIQVWGGFGSDCIRTIGSVGQVYIIILDRFNQTAQNSPAVKTGDYSLGSDCSNTALWIDNGKIKGIITQLVYDEEIKDTDPTTLPFCPRFKSDAQELESIQISPNPTSNDLTIRGLTYETTISVFDVVGRLVSEKLVSASSNNFAVGELVSGLYIIRFRKNKAIKGVKFVKI
jgi:Secretion system C-terminal sorting domain